MWVITISMICGGGAKSAGMKTIHFNRHHQVSGPCADHVVYSAKELVEFIKKD